MENSIPIMNKPAEEIVIKEYDEPAYLSQDVTWSDEDGDLAQAMISTTSSSEHTFGDTMLALDYNDFVSAKLKTYAILGDRGEHNFTFRVTDGLDNGVIQTVPVRVESDYIVPRPLSTMPKSYLFYTDMNTSELKRLESNGTVTTVGVIDGLNTNWTTVYRRADKGWLYFLNQEEERIYVVSENNASVLFSIGIDNEPNRVGTHHKQTLYLIWWRPAEGVEGEANYTQVDLRGYWSLNLVVTQILMEEYNGQLGSGESDDTQIIPAWKTKLAA